METGKAILSFSQSEKVKTGLIWISQTLEMLGGMQMPENLGGEKIILALLNMVGHEVGLARNIIGKDGWEGIENDLEQAIAMLNSGVGSEAQIHISRAISKVTNTGQISMAELKEQSLL